MKCPDCKGKNPGNPPSNIGGSFNMPCKTCGGTGEVDKIKEEFRDWYYDIPEQMYNEAGLLLSYKQGCKPRDEKIEKLREALELCDKKALNVYTSNPDIISLVCSIHKVVQKALKDIT